MNSFDYILIVLVLLLGIRGYVNGFRNEFINLIGIVGGVYIASKYGPTLAALLNENALHLENLDMLKTGVFLGLFALSWLLTGWIKKIFGNKNYKYYRESTINNLGGALLNMAKNIAIVSIVIALLGANQKLYSGYIKTIKSSASYDTLLTIGSNIMIVSNKIK